MRLIAVLVGFAAGLLFPLLRPVPALVVMPNHAIQQNEAMVVKAFAELEIARLESEKPSQSSEGNCGWDSPILSELTNDEFTWLAYRMIHGREPDPWHISLEMGHTRYSMLGAMLNSEEFRQGRLPILQTKRQPTSPPSKPGSTR